jgi:transposase InsO family protein
VVEFVLFYAALTGLAIARMVGWIGIGRDRFYDWRRRHGQTNRHNADTPRDFWLEPWEREAIVAFHREHPFEGYRRLTYMMLDRDVVAVSPSTTYRVLKQAGLLGRRDGAQSRKGEGFDQPVQAHEHWHVDVSYLSISGTFYYFCGLIDGFSRYLVHWEIRESMKEADVEIVIQRAREKFAGARPRIISDNGPQFIAKEFKSFVRFCGMTHVRTSPYYPQSNGKIERFNRSLKAECVRPKTPVSLEDARSVVGRYVDHYNDERLHGAIGYLAPRDKLEGRAKAIFDARRRKLHQARQRRKARTRDPDRPTPGDDQPVASAGQTKAPVEATAIEAALTPASV